MANQPKAPKAGQLEDLANPPDTLESVFHGISGRKDHGPDNAHNYSAAGGHTGPLSKQTKAETDALQTKLDKTAGGPKHGEEKLPPLRGGDPDAPDTNPLYGKG